MTLTLAKIVLTGMIIVGSPTHKSELTGTNVVVTDSHTRTSNGKRDLFHREHGQIVSFK